jgi:hypothetical protein
MDFNNPKHRDIILLLLKKLANIYYPAMLLMYGERSVHMEKLKQQLLELNLFNYDLEG